jgi:hypothetical protein
MKTLVNGMNEPRFWNHIASFGQARLVSKAGGRVELIGGSPADHAEAREWISLFLHNAVLHESAASGMQPKLSPAKLRAGCANRNHLPRPQTFWSGCRAAVRRVAAVLP